MRGQGCWLRDSQISLPFCVPQRHERTAHCRIQPQPTKIMMLFTVCTLLAACTEMPRVVASGEC
jgi:hypothetical protein